MSTKQIEQSALRGRRVGFQFFGTQPMHEVVGYVVGMDDYHWLIATPDEPEVIATILVHKGKPDAVVLYPKATLDTEPQAVQDKVKAIGNPYWTQLQTHNKKEVALNA